MSHHHHRGGPAPFTREVRPEDAEYAKAYDGTKIKRTKLPQAASGSSSFVLPDDAYRRVEGAASRNQPQPSSGSDQYMGPRSSKIHTYKTKPTQRPEDVPLSKKIHVGKTYKEGTRPARSPSPARYREQRPDEYEPRSHHSRKEGKVRAEPPSQVRYEEHRSDAHAPSLPRHSTTNNPTPASKSSSSGPQKDTRKRHARAPELPSELGATPHPYMLDSSGWPWWANDWMTYCFYDKQKDEYFLSHVIAQPGVVPERGDKSTPTKQDIKDLQLLNRVHWVYVRDGSGLYFPGKCTPRLKCCRDGDHDVVG